MDDEDFDGDQICVVYTAAATSEDPIYNGRDPADVTVTVLDDEESLRVYMPLIAHAWPPLPENLELLPIDNADGDGSYTVSWTAASGAEGYLLQEATDGAFSNVVEEYTSSLTSYEVNGRGASRLYYRVKAGTGAGDMGWSNAQQVDILWEAEPNDIAHEEANGSIMSSYVYYGLFPNWEIDEEKFNDYYFFDLDVAGEVEVWLSNIASERNYDLVLRDAALGQVGYSGELGNASEHIQTGTLPAGRYYIQVYYRWGPGSDQEYHLQVVY